MVLRVPAWISTALLALTGIHAAAQVTTLIGPPQGSGPTRVLTEFHLQDIDAIDDESETVSFAGSLLLRWTDARQAFDTAEAGVHELIFNELDGLPDLHPIWLPSVDLLNAAGPLEVRSEMLRITPEGTCTLMRSLNGSAKSRMDLSRFPFDEQRMEITLRIHGLHAREAYLEPSGRGTYFDQGTLRVPQWDVREAAMKRGEIITTVLGSTAVVPVVSVAIDIARDPVHILRLVLFPLAVIVVLSWGVFWMDRSSLGDRMGVSFVGILTAVTYQVLLSDVLPDISYTTFIHAFINFSFFTMALSVPVNLLVGIHDQRGRTDRGDRLDRVCRWAFPAGYVLLISTSWGFFGL